MMIYIDLDLESGRISKRKGERFDDKSLFKYGLTYVHYHESLQNYINNERKKGNVLAFPEKEF